MKSPFLGFAALVIMVGSSAAQSARPDTDTSGKGAVFCTWSIYVSMLDGVEKCGLEQGPADRDMAQSIARIEDFILKNSKHGATRHNLEAYKRELAAQTGTLSPESKAGLCHTVERMRQSIGKDIVQETDKLLSIPREPVWNPCL